MVDQVKVWQAGENVPFVKCGGTFYTKGIDYLPADSANDHWSKVEIHGADADDITRLAEIIVAALNERENIRNG